MDLLEEFWAWLGSTGGAVANLLQILGTATAVGGATYGLLRRRLRHSGAIIARLRDDLEKRTQQLDRSLQKEKQLEANYVELTRRLAETALAEARKYWRDDNYSRGHRALIEWIEREGENISKLLLYRAEWRVVSWARTQPGMASIRLWSPTGSMVCFYEKNGFKPLGRILTHPSDGRQIVEMEWYA